MTASLLFTLSDIFPYLLVFVRIGAGLSLFPGFGEVYIPRKVRLLMGMTLAILLTPFLKSALAPAPSSPLIFFLLIAQEFIIGLFIGFIVKVIFSALSTAGMVIGFQSSLSNAFSFNPAGEGQDSLPGTFLATSALLMIFATNTHHLMIRGLVDSYAVFPATKLLGAEFIFQSSAVLFAETLSKSFILTLKIAAPFLLVGLILMTAMGLMNRLVSQVQIFFVSQPLQIFLGFSVLMVVFAQILPLVIEVIEEVLLDLWAPHTLKPFV